MKARLVVLVAAATAALGSCTEVGTDPSAVVALVFDALPYPAVATGDTLRNEAGAAVPLIATPLNSNGTTVEGAVVQFLALDQGVTITGDGFVVSTDPDVSSVRLIAQVGVLQSRALTLFVTPEPDSAAQEGQVDTLRYAVPDNSSNVSGAITIRVLAGGEESPVNVRGWIVRYTVEYNGTLVPPDDSTLAWFVDPAGRRSAADTTAADGRVARRLRVVPGGLASTEDSLLVTATVTNRGTFLAGTPIQVIVPVKPRQ